MKFAVGTKSPPKLEAIKTACEKYSPLEGIDIEIISEAVTSGVSDMPLSHEETIQGAKNRAESVKNHLYQKGQKADFYIGMEGGSMVIGKRAYLFLVSCVVDNSSDYHLGFSNMIEIPSNIQERIYNNGEDLGPIMDELMGQYRTKDGKGALGCWTDNYMNRSEEAGLAFVGALSPFFNIFYK